MPLYNPAQIVEDYSGGVGKAAGAEPLKQIKSAFDIMYSEEQLLNGEIVNVVKPCLTFCFDGGYQAEYTNILPVFEAKGIKGTSYVQTSVIGGSESGQPIMTEAQILELQNLYGWEIGSHSVNHPSLPSLTEANIEYELSESKRVLEELGCEITGIAYPVGDFDERVLKLTRKYYKYGVITSTGGTINYMPTNTYKLIRYSLTQTLAQLKTGIDNSIASNAWMIIYMHGFQVDAEKLQLVQDVIDYAISVNIDIVTAKEGYERRANKIDIGFQGVNRWASDDQTYDYNGKYFYISAEGQLKSNMFGVIDTDSYTAAQLITGYPKNSVTTFRVSSSNTTGFPDATTGLCTTYKVGVNGWDRQEFRKYNTSELWSRYVNASGAWTTWVQYGFSTHIIGSSNGYAAAQPITDFPTNKITIHRVNATGSAGFPEDQAGLCTTYRFSTNGVDRQEFRPINKNEIWGRYTDGSGAWTVWAQI